MSIRDVKKALASYGLDEKETALYLATLSLGDASMTDIAEKAGLKRSTAYKIYGRMKDSGLMTNYRVSSGMRFVATHPETLIANLEKSLSRMKEVLPAIKAMDDDRGEKPRIQVFHGVMGYRAAIEDSLLKPNNTLRHIGSLNEVHAIKTEYYDLKYYMPKRIKKNIFLKSLYFSDITTKVKDVDQWKYLREIRYLPEDYKFNSAMLIYDDTVIISSSKKNLVTIMIKSQDIADAEKNKFDLMWELVDSNKKTA